MRILLALAVGSCLVAAPGVAWADPPWVTRPMTLAQNEVAFDFGVGTGVTTAGVGFNAEARYGLSDRIELGVRTGFSSSAQQLPIYGNIEPRTDYDDTARLFDRMTFDDGPDHFANPELRLRAAILRDAVGEIALEGRFVIPMTKLSGAGFAFGVPFALHFGDRVRVDAGVYEIAVLGHSEQVFNEGLQTVDTATGVIAQASLAIWVQILPMFWCGPFASFGHDFSAGAGQIPGGSNYMPAGIAFPPRLISSLGLGLGYQLSDALDLKASVMTLGRDNPTTTANLGVEWRIE
jgi:hypothetical protein